MFPTFSGSSRRPRHVDLSGQRNTNPWANSSWAPTQSGASKTVAQAQAERERRQREREELAAAKRIQRSWRGHRDRRQLRHLRRQEYDTLYRQPLDPMRARQRVHQAYPLLLAMLVPSWPDDQRRLDLFISDLLDLSPNHPRSLIDLTLFSPVAWDRLARLLVRAVERRDESSSRILVTIKSIVTARPSSVKPVLELYYVSLVRLADRYSAAEVSAEEAQDLLGAMLAPLAPEASSGPPDLVSYQRFAYTVLTSPKLGLLQHNINSVTSVLDLGALSQAIIHSFSASRLPATNDGLLWLLAHFVALNRAVPVSRDSRYLEALYLQMAFLATDIRSRSNPPERDNEYSSDSDEDTEMEDFAPLPDYVVDQLQFLVNEDGIADLLNRFASTVSTTTHISEDTSLLAGYTLVLLRCFPTYADDIKMRIFQGDIKIVDDENVTALPSVKFFWHAASKTDIFATISQQARAREQPASLLALLKQDSIQNIGWRTLLLFLELYNFLLRVTDDEDFLPRETDIAAQQSQATRRIRASSLNLDELKSLANFLKYLAFPLYYSLLDITRSGPTSERLDAMLGVGPARPRSDDTKNPLPAIGGIIGMDILGLRDLVSSALHALYERDSRRRFFPQDFWLMTSKFDMNVFMNAVVLEELRNDESSDEEEEEEADDGDLAPTRSHNLAGGWLSRSTDRRRLRTAQSDEFRSSIGPKLEVLRNMPFAIPFEVRVQIFRQFVHIDKSKRRGGHVDPDRWRLAVLAGEDLQGDPDSLRRQYLGRHNATVARGRVFDDAFDQFYPLGEGLKEPIQITFVDQFDQPEAGIDGGGVTKEFLLSVTNDAFNPERNDKKAFFVSNDQNLLYPNPSMFDDMAASLQSHGIFEGSGEWKESMNDLVKRYEFVGRIVGKCMYEGILIDISFAGFFLLKWASSGQSTSNDYRANLNDLRDLDPELYQGLMSLKNYPGDVADLSLDFTIADSVWDPSGHRRTITRPLRKDGASMPVTNRDRPLYISYVANHRLVAQQYRQTKAFLRGLGTIINPSWLSMFNQSELQRLVGGDSSEIDVEDLRQNTSYSGIYAIGDDGQEHPTIRLFWNVMKTLKDSERRDVLKYVTSTPRGPLLGFSQLKPQFSIRDGGTDEERLPSTSTCVNLLKLPVYKSAALLKAKLLYAVQSGAGFDLS
ncbi:hypothetical protein F4808DRAFT_457860 [Astrocystis sublimbata]|nr:hypothetical protein F4808DRAFT_457860 [Astrocystis sublimbata]